MMPVRCPFCEIPKERILNETELTSTLRDGFPVSPGHTLVIPKRHVASFFETTLDERAQLFEALDHAKTEIIEEFNSDGFNIGINDGQYAGQTVMHLHIHLIPRYRGDTPDPKGGIRRIFPDKADYWSDK